MKTILTIFALIIPFLKLQAQENLEKLTYAQTQDIKFFRNIKNGSLVREYITSNKNSIKVGDTLILGTPTSQEFNTRTYSGSYGDKVEGGVAQSRTTNRKTYQFILMGKTLSFGNIITVMNGEELPMANITLKNTSTVVREITTYHRGSKNKPLYMIITLGELNGRAFGLYKYLSVLDAELAIESGELLFKNSKMTRAEAIAKLKEAKDLLDIEMMTKEDYEALKKELAPIINSKE